MTDTECERTFVVAREIQEHRILAELGRGKGDSQRSLSRNLGIALGLTNLLIRRFVRNGWVEVVRVQPNRVRYLLTPAGLAAKARVARKYLQRSVGQYAEARDRTRERLSELSRSWRQSSLDGLPKRIVFYGGGAVAEIGYVSLQGTDLDLVAVVDDTVHRFFDVPVCTKRELGPQEVAGRPYDCLVVMSFGDAGKLRAQLSTLNIPEERIFWL